jgi:hypothetical protein
LVWPIRTKGINVRHDPFHSIAIWRFRIEETSGKEIMKHKEKKEKPT